MTADVGTSSPEAPQRPVFPVLDTLRAVGALAVLTTHTSFQAGAYATHGIWGALLGRLDVGVAIFFVLSGFLLFRPHVVAAHTARPGPRTGRYYWKRFLRIYPVYAVAVVLSLTLIPENRDIGPVGWVRTLLLSDTLVASQLPQGLTQMWSLAVEASFYLLLPLLAALSFGRGRHRARTGRFVALLVVMTGTSISWHLWLGPVVSDHAGGMPMTWLPSYLTWFAVGMGLAFVHTLMQAGVQDRAVRICSTLGAMPGACWVVIAGLMLVAATPVAGPTQLFVASAAESLTKHLLYAAVGGLVVLTGIFPAPDRAYASVMAHPVLRHLGHISYSLFCLHLLVLFFVIDIGGYQLFRGHGLEIWALTVAVSLVVSEVAFRLVEMPAQRLRGLSLRRPRRSGSHPTTKAHARTTRY